MHQNILYPHERTLTSSGRGLNRFPDHTNVKPQNDTITPTSALQQKSSLRLRGLHRDRGLLVFRNCQRKCKQKQKYKAETKNITAKNIATHKHRTTCTTNRNRIINHRHLSVNQSLVLSSLCRFVLPASTETVGERVIGYRYNGRRCALRCAVCIRVRLICVLINCSRLVIFSSFFF